MRVHVFGELPGEEKTIFEGLEVTFGEEIPGDVEVLVHGGVSEEQVMGLAGLRAVIVPWAGVSGEVRRAGKARGVSVYNLHHNSGATSQTAIALMLAVTRDVAGMDREFRTGSWAARFEEVKTMALEGKTAVVLGMGAIGRNIGRVCEAMDMHVIGIARSARDDVWGLDRLEEALSLADVLHVSVPLTPETKGMVNRERLALMPDGAVVVNVGRGAVIEEQALFDELKSGRFFGAGLDVWWKYPESAEENVSPGDCDWASLRNVVMTPHRGGTGVGETARWNAVKEILGRLNGGDFATGQVNLELGY